MNTQDIREQLRAIVTRNGKSGRIPELLEDELDKLVALIDSQILQARNEIQLDIAKHIEEYHYHRLNDVLIGNATVKQLIAESKDRLAHLTKQQEGK